jgi:Zn finger protein HypA/HybF involved in hydrogenase expression
VLSVGRSTTIDGVRVTQTEETCPNCDGAGGFYTDNHARQGAPLPADGLAWQDCPKCNGAKVVVHTERSLPCKVCGHKVTLWDSFLNTCENCGTDYNGCGQVLAPRSQWGEETGESLADILGPDPER